MKKIEINDDKINKYCQSHSVYKLTCYNCKKELFISTARIFCEKEKAKTEICYYCGWHNPIIPIDIYIKEKIDTIEL